MYARLDVHAVAPRLHRLIDMRRHLPAHHRPDESHQPFRFPQLATPDCLDHNQEGVVHFVVQLLRSKLAAQIESNAPREDTVERLHARRVPHANLLNELFPVGGLIRGTTVLGRRHL